MSDLYTLLLRKEAKVIMQIEEYKRVGNLIAANDEFEYLKILQARRNRMKLHIKGSA